MTIVKSGAAAVRMAASDEGTSSSAQVMSEKGSTMLRTAMTVRWNQVAGRLGSRPRASSRTAPRNSAPMPRRRATSVSGVTDSTPILMNR